MGSCPTLRNPQLALRSPTALDYSLAGPCVSIFPTSSRLPRPLEKRGWDWELRAVAGAKHMMADCGLVNRSGRGAVRDPPVCGAWIRSAIGILSLRMKSLFERRLKLPGWGEHSFPPAQPPTLRLIRSEMIYLLALSIVSRSSWELCHE